MPANSAFPIFDGHNDALLSLHLPNRGGGRSFFVRDERGHLDLPRAREGGFAGGLFAIFVPDRRMRDGPSDDDVLLTDTGYEVRAALRISTSYAQRMAIAMAARLFRLEAESAGALKVARTAGEVGECLRQGVLAAVLHFEGAEAIDRDLDALHVFYAAGLRSLGIVWSRPNAFGHGVPFKYPHSPARATGMASCSTSRASTSAAFGTWRASRTRRWWRRIARRMRSAR